MQTWLYTVRQSRIQANRLDLLALVDQNSFQEELIYYSDHSCRGPLAQNPFEVVQLTNYCTVCLHNDSRLPTSVIVLRS